MVQDKLYFRITLDDGKFTYTWRMYEYNENSLITAAARVKYIKHYLGQIQKEINAQGLKGKVENISYEDYKAGGN